MKKKSSILTQKCKKKLFIKLLNTEDHHITIRPPHILCSLNMRFHFTLTLQVKLLNRIKGGYK